MEFNIEPSDVVVPDVCPVLGINLVRSQRKRGHKLDSSPSLDRIRNDKGYIKGNVVVVSFRANRLKSDASADELLRVANFYSQVMSVA